MLDAGRSKLNRGFHGIRQRLALAEKYARMQAREEREREREANFADNEEQGASMGSCNELWPGRIKHVHYAIT